MKLVILWGTVGQQSKQLHVEPQHCLHGLSTILVRLHIVGTKINVELKLVICDRLRENLAYGIRALFAQCAFLVTQVEIYQSPDFVIYMSNNPSSNCFRRLRRLVDLYKGEISLHFDPPSRPSCCTRSPLLWALIRILHLGTARFIELLYVRSPF